jgi:hypothetical protein
MLGQFRLDFIKFRLDLDQVGLRENFVRLG